MSIDDRTGNKDRHQKSFRKSFKYLLTFVRNAYIIEIEKGKGYKKQMCENVKELRVKSGMNRKEFAEYFDIPYRTLQDWELENRKCPTYLISLMRYKLIHEQYLKE